MNTTDEIYSAHCQLCLLYIGNFICRFEIMLRQSHHLADFDINHIEVKERELGEVRLVTHLNYSSWPDHGAPENGSPLLRVSSH